GGKTLQRAGCQLHAIRLLGCHARITIADQPIGSLCDRLADCRMIGNARVQLAPGKLTVEPRGGMRFDLLSQRACRQNVDVRTRRMSAPEELLEGDGVDLELV